jgi:ferredoxin
MKYKIVQKRSECIGCGACVASCDNWEMGSDNKSRPKKTVIDETEYACNKEAADNCPVKCIEIKKA